MHLWRFAILTSVLFLANFDNIYQVQVPSTACCYSGLGSEGLLLRSHADVTEADEMFVNRTFVDDRHLHHGVTRLCTLMHGRRHEGGGGDRTALSALSVSKQG